MDLSLAAMLLRRGELVAIPTETVYGLAANALDAAAVEKIFAAKGRPRTSPLIVHVDSIGMARSLAADWPPAAEALARRFWPGPLTLVVRKRAAIPDIATAGLPTVALRMPAHPIALELIRACGFPLAAPSANPFTELSPTTAEHVRPALGDRVAMVVDGGACPVGIESAVVSVAGATPVLLRPGSISRERIEEVVGPLGEFVSTGGADPSPGMHRRHYSPRTPLYLGDPPPEGRGVWLYRERAREGGIRMPSDAEGYAARLYETLRELDLRGADWIAVEPPPDEPEWEAVRDRLTRAAER